MLTKLKKMSTLLDLNELLVTHPAATFFVRAQGDSMQNAGIFSEDILVVDRALEPKEGTIVVAILNGEFTLKRVLKKDTEYQIWGVVTYVIHKTR